MEIRLPSSFRKEDVTEIKGGENQDICAGQIEKERNQDQCPHPAGSSLRRRCEEVEKQDQEEPQAYLHPMVDTPLHGEEEERRDKGKKPGE